MKGREVFNHFYNADSITDDLELVSECRRTDDEPVEGQSLPDSNGSSGSESNQSQTTVL